MKLTINLDEEEQEILEKRAKKNLLSLTEQVEDIIRRSCVNTGKSSASQIKVDDKIVHIISREKKGRKPKKRK